MSILSRFKGKGVSTTKETLSVKEMWERALGPADGKGGRPLELIMAVEPVRLVPLNILETAEKHLQETGKVDETLAYIQHAFYLYRGSVCHDIAAPHVERNGVFEWPDAETLSWTDVSTVIFFDAIAHQTPKTVEVSVREENQIQITDLSTGLTEVRNARWKDDLSTEFKYKVVLSDVGFIYQQGWQRESLRIYANPLHWLMDDLSKGNLAREEAQNYLELHIVNLKETPQLPVAFYKNLDREGREFDLMAWMF